MSYRPKKSWGYFDKNGRGIATGDDHKFWVCPHRVYVRTPQGGFELEPECHMAKAANGNEVCGKCGVRFIDKPEDQP